ncbi:type VI secretion system tip protein VgrG, partial [Pseudomonas aeruginosa]|nr:type VI secretion system tip protein VgrG [Pseudomonas aeruginosa]
PRNFVVKAAKHSHVGPAYASTAFNSWSGAPFDQRVRVVRGGGPLPNYRYALVYSDGARVEGVTDKDGWTALQQELTSEGYEIELLGPAEV